MAAALLVATAARADDFEQRAHEVARGRIETVTGKVRDVRGGAYLPTAVNVEQGQRIARLEAENAKLSQVDPRLVAAVTALVIIAAGAGYAAGRAGH